MLKRIGIAALVTLVCSLKVETVRSGSPGLLAWDCRYEHCHLISALSVRSFDFDGPIAKAIAGETFLGTIVVSDGGTVNNASTGYASAGCAVGGACAQAFRVPFPAPITIQAITALTVVVNGATADAGNGVQLTAGQFFTSSTAATACKIPLLPDGGSYVGGCVAIAPAAGSASATATVFSRQGNE